MNKFTQKKLDKMTREEVNKAILNNVGVGDILQTANELVFMDGVPNLVGCMARSDLEYLLMYRCTKDKEILKSTS